MSDSKGFRVTVLSVGDSNLIEEGAIPISEELEKVLQFQKELPEPMRLERGATNDLTPYIILGVALFSLKELTKLAIKDGYETLIRPRLKGILERIDARLSKGNQHSKKAFHVDVWYEEYQVLVSVAVLGNTYAEVNKQLPLASEVHANALTWINVHGVQRPVHYYTIDAGRVNAEPVLLKNAEETVKMLRG